MIFRERRGGKSFLVSTLHVIMHGGNCIKFLRKVLRGGYTPGKTIRKGRKGAGGGGDGNGKSPFVLFRVRISDDVRLRLPRSFRFTRNWIIDLL